MSYTITIRVFKTGRNHYYHAAEKTAVYPASWSEVDETHVLRLGNSGASGMLRFVAAGGPGITLALGVHNYKPWCDIKSRLTDSDTATAIQPKYYQSGTPEDAIKWKQLSTYSIDGHTITYTVTEGHDLVADFVIG